MVIQEHRATPTPRYRARETDSLALNFFPAILSTTTALVWSGRFPGAEAAEALRQDQPGLVTWRDPDDASRMYIWNPSTPLTNVPAFFQEVTVALEESPPLFQRLINDAIAGRLRDLGFQEKSGGWVNYNRPSLMTKIPALASAAGEAIGIYPKILVDVFFTRDAADQLLIGAIIDILYTSRMDVTAAEWAAAGLIDELRGAYVTLVANSVKAAKYNEYIGRSIGKIDDVRGDHCVLTDLRDSALAELPLTDVAPEPTRANLALYLDARYKQAYAAGERALIKKLREMVRPRSRYDLARCLVFKRLQSSAGFPEDLTILPGLTMRLADTVKVALPSFPARRLDDPEYSFDRAGNKYARRVDEGLRRYGPYDTQLRQRDSLRLLVVAPNENKGDVQLSIPKLLNGIQTSKNVFTGLKHMYRLQNLQVTYAFATTGSGSPMKHYADAVNRAIREAPPQTGGSPHFHMLLTVIHEAHRALPDSENPYFQTKALALIAEHVPTQAITIEKLRQQDDDLQYILNTMALACYAKLGGTSHVLKLPKVVQDSPTELIFGIGRSVRRIGRFGEAEETIGFATVFRANGEYIYNDCTPYCDDAQYERALEETIRRTVERVAAFEQLSEGAPLRLIFHVPRRPGRREERPILNAVGKLPQYKIEFALLHVNDDHHLQLFDLANLNPQTYSGKPKPEAVLLPARGYAVTIGPRERLVTFIGIDQYRGNGCPTPLKITLDKRSTFKDVEYLTQQLFLLSFMSVRSLNPSIAPATIIYAEKLAQLTGHLRGVQQWTVELIHQHLGRKLWFI
jgi:hypothetical protein